MYLKKKIRKEIHIFCNVMKKKKKEKSSRRSCSTSFSGRSMISRTLTSSTSLTITVLSTTIRTGWVCSRKRRSGRLKTSSPCWTVLRSFSTDKDRINIPSSSFHLRHKKLTQINLPYFVVNFGSLTDPYYQWSWSNGNIGSSTIYYNLSLNSTR